MNKQLITIDNLKYTLPVIDFNINDMKAKLTAALAPYKTMTFEEGQTKELKAVITEHNKAEKMVDDYRKMVKKEVSAPISKFEDDCHELKAIINESRREFKDTYDAIETERVEIKRNAVQLLMNDMVADSDLMPPFDANIVFDKKYLNKTMTINDVADAIYDQIEKLSMIQEVLNAKLEKIEMYVVIANSKHALSIDYKPYQSMLDYRSVEEITELIDMCVDDLTKPVIDVAEITEEEPEEEPEEVFFENYRITATEQQFKQLDAYMKRLGIKWETL